MLQRTVGLCVERRARHATLEREASGEHHDNADDRNEHQRAGEHGN